MNSRHQNLILKYFLIFWKKRDFFYTAWFILRMNQRNFDLITKRLCLQLSKYNSILLTFFNIIENLMNQNIDVTQQYINTLQRSDQMIWMFTVYLSTLKHQLSLYSDEHKRAHLFIKLRSELHVTIINVQLIFITWDILINLVTQLKINLQKEHVLSLKWLQDRDSYD